MIAPHFESADTLGSSRTHKQLLIIFAAVFPLHPALLFNQPLTAPFSESRSSEPAPPLSDTPSYALDRNFCCQDWKLITLFILALPCSGHNPG